MDGLRISELAERVGVAPSTVRYHERIGLVGAPSAHRSLAAVMLAAAGLLACALPVVVVAAWRRVGRTGLADGHDRSRRHRRALTTLTLIAGTASFVFQPLTSVLTAAHGWRTSLLILAAILAAVTIPLPVRLLAGTKEAARDIGLEPAGTAAPIDRRFWPSPPPSPAPR